MSAAMNSCLEHFPSLQGKRVLLLLTHFFFRGWGAEQTIEQMEWACESKGAMLSGWESMRWTSLQRRREISRVVDSPSDRIRSTETQPS
jgi:hypothetical protein